MDPEIKAMLQRIMWTIGSGILWMLPSALIGLKGEWAFYVPGHGLGTSLFYIWFIGGFIVWVWLLVKMWRPHL
jgi:hypothetical protein